MKRLLHNSPLPLGEGTGVGASDALKIAKCKMQIANCKLSAPAPHSPIPNPSPASPHPNPLPKGEGTRDSSDKRDKLSPKQLEVLRVLAAAEEPLTPGELARAARCTSGPITALRRKGLIRSRSGRIATLRPQEAPAVREKHLVLNPDQQRALRNVLDAMNSRRHQTILIHGVTGSGKTEVYIQAIQEVIHFGRQAIVLVPEISLTPQTVERFSQRFGTVAVLHSHLSDAERHWHWQRIAEGAVSVVVGAAARSSPPRRTLG